MKTFTLAIRITTVVALSLLMVQCGNKQAAPNQSVSDDTTISSYRDKLNSNVRYPVTVLFYGISICKKDRNRS